MKRALAFLLCFAIFLPCVCVSVNAQENYTFYRINIDAGSGALSYKAIVQDGDIYIPATSFSDYTRFFYDEVSRTFLIKGQEVKKAIKYVMVDSKNKRMLIGGRKTVDLSDCFESEDELYLPLCQMLPILNADIYEVKDNTIYISNNRLSLAEVLYDFDVTDYYYNIATEFYDMKSAAALAIVPSYIWDSVVSARFDRLDIFYGSGEYNDYKDAFSDFLSDDNLYLKAMAQNPSEIDSIVELFNGANNVAKNMKSVYGWIEAAGKSDISTETGGALLDALKECYDSGELEVDDLKGLNDAWTSGKISFGDCIEILTYVYTYVTQVEDNRQMLNAVYSVDSKINKAETARRAAKQVYDLYGDNVVPALHKEILTTVAGGALEDLSPIGIYTATAKVSGLVFKNIIPYDPEEVAKLPIYSDIVLSASSKYHLYDFSTDEGTENLRLSLLLCMMASKKCFEVMGDVFEAESTHYKNKIEKIERLIMGLYIAEENTAFDSYEHFEEHRALNLVKLENIEKIEEFFDFGKYVGKYKTDNDEIELTIFDVAKDGRVFFEIELKEDWLLSGVANLEDNKASFSLFDDSNRYENKGTITFDADVVNLSISSMQRNFEENVGNYTLKRYADVGAQGPYADNEIGIEDFGVFTSFIENQYGNSNPKWAYLGSITYWMGSWGEYLGGISHKYLGVYFDLYRLTIGNKDSYYGVCVIDLMEEDEVGVFEIVGGRTSFCFKKERLAPNYDALLGTYKGSYFAAQGETGLTLTVFKKEDKYKALFDFYNLPGKNNAKSGKYYMDISYDKNTGTYYFDPYEWISKPSTYDFVELKGKLTNDVLSGDSPTRFSVTKTDTTQTTTPNDSRISLES